MPKIVAGPSAPSCSFLFPESAIQQSQPFAPDPFVPPARDARGRFAEGSSGNRRGRPSGIPNPKRRVPDLVARPLSAQALSDLLDRQPHLLRLLAAQLLPPPLAAADPAERLGLDLSALPTTEDCRRALATAWAAVARGEIAPAEAALIAWRVRAGLQAIRRRARLARQLARNKARLANQRSENGSVDGQGQLSLDPAPLRQGWTR